jgi:hypothetical protein
MRNVTYTFSNLADGHTGSEYERVCGMVSLKHKLNCVVRDEICSHFIWGEGVIAQRC